VGNAKNEMRRKEGAFRVKQAAFVAPLHHAAEIDAVHDGLGEMVSLRR